MPLVSSKAKPVAIDIVPSVTMNGEMRRNATHRPLTRPTTTPHPEAGENAGEDDEAGLGRQRSLRPTMTSALDTLVSATTAPTRQVEAADDEDQHLAGGDDHQIGRTAQHVEKVLHDEEVRHEDREQHDEHHQQDRQESDRAVETENSLEGRRSCRAAWSVLPRHHVVIALLGARRLSSPLFAEEMGQHVGLVDVGSGQVRPPSASDA